MSPQEIADLLGVVDHALENATVKGLTPDARIGLAYPGALAIGATGLAASGYRAGRDRHHERVLDSLLHTLGTDPVLVGKLHRFRRMRNEMTYERVGTVSESEAKGFLALVAELRRDVVMWLRLPYYAGQVKGEHLWSADEAKEKRAVGQLWAERSGGSCIFVMPNGTAWGEIDAAFRPAAH